MALFLSTTTNKIDKKGRVSVPALFRAAVDMQKFPGIILFRSLQQPIIEGCDYERLTNISQQFETTRLNTNTPMNNNNNDDYAAMMFAEAQMITFDAEGRISIPQYLFSHAEITDQVTFVGRGSTFELWQPQRFEAYHEAMRQRLVQSKVTP